MAAILWHRRETRRLTENTNFSLRVGKEPAYSPVSRCSSHRRMVRTRMRGCAKGDRMRSLVRISVILGSPAESGNSIGIGRPGGWVSRSRLVRVRREALITLRPIVDGLAVAGSAAAVVTRNPRDLDRVSCISRPSASSRPRSARRCFHDYADHPSARDKRERLKAVVRARKISVNKLVGELATVALANHDAFITIPNPGAAGGTRPRRGVAGAG
jgi:hypothetical protein